MHQDWHHGHEMGLGNKYNDDGGDDGGDDLVFVANNLDDLQSQQLVSEATAGSILVNTTRRKEVSLVNLGTLHIRTSIQVHLRLAR